MKEKQEGVSVFSKKERKSTMKIERMWKSKLKRKMENKGER